MIHQFSGGQIKDNIFAAENSELTLSSYLEYVNGPKPLSEVDKKLKMVNDSEAEARNEHQTNFKILPGIVNFLVWEFIYIIIENIIFKVYYKCDI